MSHIVESKTKRMRPKRGLSSGLDGQTNPPKIAINLKTAEIIGYDPPVDVLGAADEIYQEIEKPE